MSTKEVSGNAGNTKKTKSLIYAAAFAAIYIVVMVIIVMGSASIPVLYVASPLIVGIVLGTVYMLAVLRTKSIVPVVIMGLGYIICTGMGGWQTAVLEVIWTVLSCLVLIIGKFSSKKVFGLSYTVFNMNMSAPFIMLLIARDKFIQQSSDMYGEAHAEALDAATQGNFYLIVLAFAFVGGIIGAFLGTKLVSKHFEKAGVN